jgi:hypothetical protein
MKKISIILTLLFCSIQFVAKSQTSLRVQLQNFPLTNYLNKPIDSLLANLPAGYDTAFFITCAGHIQKGASLQVNYMPDFKFWVYIEITNPQYITVKRTTAIPAEVAWPLHLLRKEKIGRVTIFTEDYRVVNEACIY